MNSDNIQDFLKLVKLCWETSRITMILKPMLYLLTVIIATFKNDIAFLAVCGFICIILDLILNTYETKKFEEKIEKIDLEKEELKLEKEELNEDKKKLQNDVSQLQDEIEVNGEILKNHLIQFLVFLNNQLNLERSDRISVYIRDEENCNFEIVGRYSANPNYNRIGRPKYDGNKGYISKCWQSDSEDFIKILPEIDTEEYYNEQELVGYTKQEVGNLSMTPRLFYVLNIAKVGYPSIGVIVIESTQDKLGNYKNYYSDDDGEGLRKRIAKELKKYSPYLYDVMDTKVIRK
jgi:hypothetical protein